MLLIEALRGEYPVLPLADSRSESTYASDEPHSRLTLSVTIDIYFVTVSSVPNITRLCNDDWNGRMRNIWQTSLESERS